MKIRKARLRDIPEIIKLWKKLNEYEISFKSTREFNLLAPGAEKKYRNEIKRKIRSKNALVLIAADGNKPIAFIHSCLRKGYPYLKSDVKLIGYINDLYVKRSYRGKGIASALVKETFKWFKKKGAKYTEVFTIFPNKSAHKAYKSWGFKELGLLLKRRL